ncbi:Relaxase/Mobilisation nuclease domain-containing protein [Mucilaginibacter pineti]|uniref:Relaxase/Mobilisation nuclease domain-containing protein n=2 Tax=Mucilaginibacter pineti TaxID=1391627 RepID=A0A1G7N7Y9_9SPHI|nr:Relaxase/Mobilisation nuclease domain-containing protein [Mucilaginibacter pineti]
MKVANFGPLQGLGTLRPEDYVNYLQMISARNKGVKQPQFHATISAKGKSHDKVALTTIAEDWLKLMGYAEQPYLIVFHKDTANNHVHIVSTRIDRQGKKISSAFEHNRAIQNLNKVLGLDEKLLAEQDLEKALSYQFGTKAAFMMILEGKGYHLKQADDKMAIIKFGRQLAEVSVAMVIEKEKTYQPDDARRKQLAALLHKHPEDYLRDKLGVQLLFHGKPGKEFYGYSILDHANKRVWKGSEIMPLSELLALKHTAIPVDAPQMLNEVSSEVKDYYRTLVHAAHENYPDFAQGLQENELALEDSATGLVLTDKVLNVAMPADSFIDRSVYIPPIMIADDVDDQQIHGMRRRRQQKARTNTR